MVRITGATRATSKAIKSRNTNVINDQNVSYKLSEGN